MCLASEVALANVNGNRLLVVLGAAAEAARASPTSFFDTFSTKAFDSLIVGLSRGSRVRMRVFERDGSESAFCGNGSLALAAALGRAILIDTPHGFVPAARTAVGAYAALPRPTRIVAATREASAAYAACGEPHALYRVDRAWRNPPGTIGSHHAPERNCTVVEYDSPATVRIRTYERGVNAETGSCGTGACAALAMLEAASTPLAERVRVEMKGGTLFVTRRSDRFVLEAPVTLEPLTR
ncbi:MAG: hypothetical protein KGI78_04080 [Patescibacteria group bacterium]|nr:hypothetical protein [Patescibacteria group bacterium]MDE1944012.1 hypothetical protein [Patescibacteria group bacterium]MDE1945158.1 hypothetical protein [Patescibacteria group bacterium]MDE2057998.1 hypothetical protein [Patescibacteria group bacterium]